LSESKKLSSVLSAGNLYCCGGGGGLLGGFGAPNPGLDDEFELFPNPEEELPKLLPPLPNPPLVPKALPVLLPLPFWPLRFGVPCCPNPCSCGW
jgi:hypothetical protein